MVRKTSSSPNADDDNVNGIDGKPSFGKYFSNGIDVHNNGFNIISFHKIVINAIDDTYLTPNCNCRAIPLRYRFFKLENSRSGLL